MGSADELLFGICIDQNQPWETLVERWRFVESLGFDSIWDCDHYMQPSRPDGPYFEGWSLLAALATVTRRARLGVLVSSNTFRHPALLAKMAATVDHVSGGRLDVGLGAGWYEPEHEKFGLDFPPPGERVGRFREAVEVVDMLLRQDVSTYHGRYYQLREAPFRPAPVQKPRPRLMLAAHGRQMLKIVARYADSWNSFGSPDEIRQRNAILDEHCAAIGRDPRSVSRSLYGWATQVPTGEWATERSGSWAQGLAQGRTVLPNDPWDSPQAFRNLVAIYREAGINEFIIDIAKPEQFKVMETVAADVIPELRRTNG